MGPEVNPRDTPAGAEAASGLDGQLCFSLYAASLAMTRLYKPLLDGLGLTYPQYLVLHALWEADGRPLGAVAERLGLPASTLTPLVRRLESAGLVARERDPEDERRVLVRLRSAGAELRQRTACLTEAVVGRTGYDLPRLQALAAEVVALRRALGAPPVRAAPRG